MQQAVVLIDLQYHQPTLQQLRALIESDVMVYLFHAQGKSPFALDQLTELAQMIQQQQLVILEHTATGKAAFDYAVVVGQVLALMPLQAQVYCLSTMPYAALLQEMFTQAGVSSCAVVSSLQPTRWKHIDQLMQHPLADKLRHQVQLVFQLCQQHVPKKLMIVLQHTTTRMASAKLTQFFGQFKHAQYGLDSLIEQLRVESMGASTVTAHTLTPEVKIDPVQIAIVKQLDQLKAHKPKDIYALRDFLAQSFPESDIRRLLKELIDKGYIHCEGIQVTYSHEMYLN